MKYIVLEIRTKCTITYSLKINRVQTMYVERCPNSEKVPFFPAVLQWSCRPQPMQKINMERGGGGGGGGGVLGHGGGKAPCQTGNTPVEFLVAALSPS